MSKIWSYSNQTRNQGAQVPSKIQSRAGERNMGRRLPWVHEVWAGLNVSHYTEGHKFWHSMSKVGNSSQALGCLCLGDGGSVSEPSPSEDVSYYWRSSFAKNSLSLWAQTTVLEAPLTAGNTSVEEAHLHHIPIDQLHSLGPTGF